MTGSLSASRLAALNTEELKAKRKASAFFLEHPEEFAKTVQKDATRIELERKELEAIKEPEKAKVTDPNRTAKIQELLQKINNPKSAE